MVISHRYRYLFVQIPMTGCTAIGTELVDNYAGERILSKHASYREFLAQASNNERTYYVFASIRDPFDRAVSHYYKFCCNHEDYLSPRYRSQHSRKTIRYQRARLQYLEKTRADFPRYLQRFFSAFDPKLPPPHIRNEQADFLIRFERLQQDFQSVLKTLAIEPQRELPARNLTPGREHGFLQHYDQRSSELATAALGPSAQYWGYEIPPEWSLTIPVRTRLIFRVKMSIRRAISLWPG
jgi:hypothetical protein